MADAAPFLHRRALLHDQQSAQRQEEESVGFPGVTVDFDAPYRSLAHRSDSHPYRASEIGVRAIPGAEIMGKVEFQPNRAPTRTAFVIDPALVPSQGPQFEVQGRPQGILGAFVSVCKRWGLTRDDQSKLLGFPPGDFVAQSLLGGGIPPSSQDVRERVGFVVGISITLGALFGRNHEAELAWLNQRRAKLDGKTPLQCMLQRRMLNLAQVSELLRQERGL